MQDSKNVVAVSGPVVHIKRAGVGRPDDLKVRTCCPDVFFRKYRLLSHDHDDSQFREQFEQSLEMRKAGGEISVDGGSDFLAGTYVPRHYIPDNGMLPWNSRLSIEFEEILR
jgi:hypothetical protein